MECDSRDPLISRVLSGAIAPEEVPEVPQRVVRVFLSSTGADSLTERNAFVERVYPPLREYCKKRYGVEFQMVDLEWGLPPTNRNFNASDADFRYRELQRCHTLSSGPSFVAFIGQKYGETSLPSVILSQEFEAIRIALKGHKGRDTRAAPLLDEWYTKDDNSIPPVHLLTKVQEKIPDYLSSDSKKRKEAREQWATDMSEMKRLLQRGAELSYLEGLIDGDSKLKYNISAQDMTIQFGTEECGAPKSRCILLMRTIVDLKNYVDDAKASDFTEVVYNEKTERKETDANCSNKLSQLKTRAKCLISENNSHEYDVLWRYDDVIHPKLHAPYLGKICKEFHDTLKRLIDETVQNTKFDVEPDIFEEVLQHWGCCKRKATEFFGQEDLLKKGRSYLTGKTDKPFVVYGLSGSGKSTLLSKLASEVRKMSKRTVCCLRYIGYTPKSSDIKQVIMSICQQLLCVLGRPTNDIPFDFTELQRYFHDLIQSVPADVHVVIFMDSLEKLAAEYNAYFMSWLPNKLKENVKIVVSTHPEEHNILERLKTDVVKDVSCMVEVTQMSASDAEGLLQYNVGLYSRKLSPPQFSVFRKAFNTCSLAMYVQLLGDIARNLTSFQTLDDCDIPTNIEDAINKLLDGLEKKHGRILVSRALSYLVASVTGLSDCEMEDILSLDDGVLNSIYTTFHPPVRRIPFVHWLLLKNDMEQFLTHRDADGVTVYFWTHEEFSKVIRQRYLQDEDVVKEIHSMLADYFLGTWFGKSKPIAVAEGGDSVCLPCGKEAPRLVTSQPLSYENPGAPDRFNKRKYDQVPRHLYLAGRFKELNGLVLFNYEWLYNKIKALSLTHIMADFVLNPGEEATLVVEALRVAESTIQNDINNLAPEITGHLLPYYKTHPNIRELVRQCDTAGLKHCALIPNFPYLQVPGSSLQYTLTSPVVGEFFKLTKEDRNLLVKVKDSSMVHVFDVATGEKKGSVFASNGELYVTPNGKLFIIVDHITEKAIKVHNAETGAYVGQLIVMNHIELKVKEKYKMGAVSLTNERMSVIVTTETSFLCIADLVDCQFMQIIGLDGKCDVCVISPDGRYVFCNSNEFVLCYDMYSLEHVCTVSAGQRPSTLAFTQDGLRAFVANTNETKLLVMHIHKGAVEMAYKTPLDEDLPGDKIQSLTVSSKDDMVLIRGLNNIVVYNRLTEKVVARFPRPPDVPQEFKLPKSHYSDLTFTNAEFSRDGKFVIGTLFRNIYLWQISTGNLITTIQAPVGIISEIIVSKRMSQLITHIRGSSDIQVWNIAEAVNQVNMLDKLTSSIVDIKTTPNNLIAYIRCKGSDEIGVVDMHNGIMLDLLTHDAPAIDFACSADGRYVLISTEPKKKANAFKLWDMDERQVIKEFGKTSGMCLSPSSEQFMILVAQQDMNFKAPYYITQFSFTADGVKENVHPLSLKYILDKPFLTQDDAHLIVLTAQEYWESEGYYDTPTICAFSLADDLKVSYYTPESFRDAADINTIVRLLPCKEKPEAIIVIYTTNAIIVGRKEDESDNCEALDQLGLLVLDITSGAIITICEPFLRPGALIENLVFSGLQFCVDEEYNIFDLTRGIYIGQLDNPGVPPSGVALYGTVVIYYIGARIYAVHISSGRLIANCEVHSEISRLVLCSDQRTIVAGCLDGTIVSYVLVDPNVDDTDSIVSSLGSRFIETSTQNGRLSRCWDKTENGSVPSYSRPPSAMSTGPKEKTLLNQVKPAPKVRPNSETLIYLNERSKTCVLQ